jgi:hypothetical protein
MTRKTAFITVVVAAAFVLAVPAAWGATTVQPDRLLTGDDHVLAVQPDRILSGDDHVLLDSSSTVLLDSHERGAAIGRDQLASADAFERAVAARVAATRVISGDDHVRIDPADLPVSVPSTSSGRDEWPQVGIGLGVGIVLAFGLLLAVRYTRTRPLAH